MTKSSETVVTGIQIDAETPSELSRYMGRLGEELHGAFEERDDACLEMLWHPCGTMALAVVTADDDAAMLPCRELLGEAMADLRGEFPRVEVRLVCESA